MLFLEPLWVYASVAFLVACARHHLLNVDKIWGNTYLTSILLMVCGVFTPIENWVLHRHTAWETTFTVRDVASNSALALAPLLHVVTALIGYRVSVYQLAHHGVTSVIKCSMWAFSIFFVIQGMFHDTLMYSGSYDEFHAGEEKDFLSFFFTEQFRDGYIMFFLMFGPVFYYLCISWSSGTTKEDKCSFIKNLAREAMVHGAVVCVGYLLASVSGVLPDKFGVWRTVYIFGMHFISHFLLITPLFLSSTKQRQE